jgi:hypothetical protein
MQPKADEVGAGRAAHICLLPVTGSSLSRTGTRRPFNS